MRTWGFEYKTTITWVKDRMGLGQYFRGLSEHCLFGVRGNLPYRTRPDGKRAQGTTAFIAPRAEHSTKPEDMRRMIETVSYGSYLELFARRPAEGWHVWGNQVTPDVSIGSVISVKYGKVAPVVLDDGIKVSFEFSEHNVVYHAE